MRRIDKVNVGKTFLSLPIKLELHELLALSGTLRGENYFLEK